MKISDLQERRCCTNIFILPGLEQVPIPVINGVNNDMLDFCHYSTKRVPMEGVHINCEPEFLCGCDCEDDCIVSRTHCLTRNKPLTTSFHFPGQDEVLVLETDVGGCQISGQRRGPQLGGIHIQTAAGPGDNGHIRVQFALQMRTHLFESRRPESDVAEAAGVPHPQSRLGHQEFERRAAGHVHLYLCRHLAH